MELTTRRIFSKLFSGSAVLSIVLLAAALLVFLVPVFWRGMEAFVFEGTVEFRTMQLDKFERGDPERIDRQKQRALAARKPVYDMLSEFEQELDDMSVVDRMEYKEPFSVLKDRIRQLLGPPPDAPKPSLPRDQYGATRMDAARETLHSILYKTVYKRDTSSEMGTKAYEPRRPEFKGTAIAPLFDYMENNLEEMMQPQREFYWQFLIDRPIDANFFGGIWPALLGTLYLTVGAVIFAVPMGVLSAIYLIEYAGDNWLVSILRTFVSTLAGVPSIVFGLFGLAFFINTVGISDSKSVLAGALTLGLLILPMVIRAAEEALRSVPGTYKEAALSLGASRWRTILTVILPTALPGIISGIIISMGRAAGETAPIIFTAAVSVGAPLGLLDTFSEPTQALSWGIYNLATEHEAADEIRHVQYGMALTLISLVLLLNLAAIILRSKLSKKQRG